MDEQNTLQEPARAEVDAISGPAIIEFGSWSCGICRAAQPAIEAARTAYPRLPYIKVEDGRGRPLGRSFGVKLWPTLVFMLDGRETARLVRPVGGAIAEAFAHLSRLAARNAAANARSDGWSDGRSHGWSDGQGEGLSDGRATRQTTASNG